MTLTYNHDRSLDQRHKRFHELAAKQVTKYEAKYNVITTRDGADGDFCGNSSVDHHYFTSRATAVAYAQHYSDICDHVAGIFKMPEFIARVDVR